MYLLGIKDTSVNGKNEKGYPNPINIAKASAEKEIVLDGVKQLIQNGYKVNDLVILEEISFNVDISVS